MGLWGMFLKRRLLGDLHLLVLFNALRNITDLFLGTFLISFLMHLSSDEIVSVSAYKLFEYTATCSGFFLFANWVKRYNKISVFALNFVPQIVLLALIIILGNRVVDYVLPLGALYGIGAAMFHLPMHAMVADKIPVANMGYFVGLKNAANYTVKIIAPVVLGCFIDTGSYTEMAYVLLFLSVVEFALVFCLRPNKSVPKRRANFIGFYNCMMRFPVIRRMFLMEILRGFGLGLLGTVITMYTVYIFHTDLKLGIYTTIFALCSVLTCWIFRRVQSGAIYDRLLMFCIALVTISVLMFVLWTTPVSFLFYNLIYSTAIVLMDQINSTTIYRMSCSCCITDDTRTEYFVFRDFALFIGRWIGFTGLMYIGVFGGYAWLRWYLILIGLAVVLWGCMNRHMFFCD